MNNKNDLNDFTDLIGILRGNSKALVIFTVLSMLLALLFTSFKEKKYSSSSTFFPSSFNAPDIATQSPRMGFNIEADRLIQVGRSNDIKDSLIERFKLIDKFNIDTTNPSWRNGLHSKLGGMMDFERTKYMSVVLSVTSHDPNLSAELANYTTSLLSRYLESMYKQNSRKSLMYNEVALLEKNKEILTIIDSISSLRQSNKNEKALTIKNQLLEKQRVIDAYTGQINGLLSKNDFYDQEFQLEMLTEQRIECLSKIETEQSRMENLKNKDGEDGLDYLNSKAELQGAQKNLEYINASIESLKLTGSSYDLLKEKLRMELNQYAVLESQYESLINSHDLRINSAELEDVEARLLFERQQFNKLKDEYEQSLNYFNKPLPNIFISEKAVPNYIKSSPSYLKNALIGAVLGFFASFVFLVFVNYRKN